MNTIFDETKWNNRFSNWDEAEAVSHDLATKIDKEMLLIYTAISGISKKKKKNEKNTEKTGTDVEKSSKNSKINQSHEQKEKNCVEMVRSKGHGQHWEGVSI